MSTGPPPSQFSSHTLFCPRSCRGLFAPHSLKRLLFLATTCGKVALDSVHKISPVFLEISRKKLRDLCWQTADSLVLRAEDHDLPGFTPSLPAFLATFLLDFRGGGRLKGRTPALRSCGLGYLFRLGGDRLCKPCCLEAPPSPPVCLCGRPTQVTWYEVRNGCGVKGYGAVLSAPAYIRQPLDQP